MTMAIPQSGMESREPTDPRVERAGRGDRAAQEELLCEWQDVWFRFSLSQLRDEHLARDATQETAIRFLKRLSRFRGNSTLKTWSLGIALNVCREMRRRRDRTIDERRYLATRDNSTAASDDDAAIVRDLVADLPDRQREAITLRFLEGLSVEETAGVMRCAPGTVKATVSQATRNLRQRWKATS